jgi:hypothetical protein
VVRTELAVFALYISVKLVACSTQELESLHSSKPEPIESQQGKAELDNHILHGKVAG